MIALDASYTAWRLDGTQDHDRFWEARLAREHAIAAARCTPRPAGFRTRLVRHTSRARNQVGNDRTNALADGDRAAARGGEARRFHSCAGASRGSHPRRLRPMLPGFSGHLISESFPSAAWRARSRASGSSEPGRHRLSRCRERASSLGPASSLRALLEAGATPFFRELGFVGPIGVESLKSTLAATLSNGSTPIALIVAPSGTKRLDALWRDAVVYSATTGSLLVSPLQRHPCTGHRNQPPVLTPLRAVRPRRGARRRPGVGGAPVGPSGIVVFNGRGSAAVRAPPACSGLGRRFCAGSPIAQARSAPGVGRCPRSAGIARRLARRVRAGADNRVPRALPALRRSAGARAPVAPGVP